MVNQDNRLMTVIKLSRQAFAKYKGQIFGLIVLGLLGGVFEGIGVNALIPLFSFTLGNGDGGADPISKMIQKFFGFFHLSFSVQYLLFFIIFLFVAKATILVFIEYVKSRIINDYEEKTRRVIFKRILDASWPYLIKQKLGYLETILMIDVSRNTALLNHISGMIVLVSSLFIYSLVAINISVSITLITLVLGLIFFLVIKPIIYKTKVYSYQLANLNKYVAHYVNENIFGIKTVKTMMIQDDVAAKGNKYFLTIKTLMIKLAILKSFTGSFVMPVALIFICSIFAFTYQDPGFNLAALAVVVYLIQKIFIYIEQMQKSLHTIVSLVPHLKNVLNYEKEAAKNHEINEGVSKFVFAHSLEFRNVSFSYNPDNLVLSDLNFVIKKGEMVGLIGPSGVGKTTLVDLVLRLFPLNQGQIKLDGVDATEISLADWRKNIGYVSQDIFLTNDTIANNIKFYDNSITDQDVITAAKMANIYDFVGSLPGKFETVVGERGILVSAGQRQRIVIARILARQPQLLVLDEATSALDNESEAKIQEVIRGLKGKVTTLVIAHRLSTVMDSDQLIVLRNGQIAEQGRPAELLKDNDSYFFRTYNIR